jgi:steroid delta-isomerase-like uncharacterized protein
MSISSAKKLVSDFYKYWNNGDLDGCFSLVSDDVTYEFNYLVGKGKESYKNFMKYAVEHYKEHVNEPIIMVSEDGKHVATKFIVEGTYIKADHSGVPAIGQKYILDVVNYFEIQNGKFTKGCALFDESKWLEQVKNEAFKRVN